MSENLIKANFTLSQSDVREVLQYVPLFSGKTFVVAINGDELEDSVLAEVLLDFISLQRIGVRLALAYSGVAKSALLDWAAEVELKLSEALPEDCESILKRGQAALVPTLKGFHEPLVNLAIQIKADKILFLGEAESFPKEWQGALKLNIAQKKLKSKIPEEIGAIVIQAVKKGVDRVHLLDGKMPGCLSKELFSNEGVGVMIYSDSYQEIRPLSAEDIPELLAIIGRPVRAERLLPRTYEEVESQLQDYYVMALDGNVVGSVAIHPYEDAVCELACLFIKESHKGLRYGHDLVKFAESKATELGYKQIFALTTEAVSFFQKQMGYKQIPLEELPRKRYVKVMESGRSSIALMKELS